MHLSQRRLQLAEPIAIEVTEPGIAEAVPRTCPGAVFLPEQRQCHVRPPQFAVDHRPIRHRAQRRGHVRRRRVEQRLQPIVVQFVRQWPAKPRQTGPAQAAVHRADADPQADSDRPLAQPLRQPQPQHLSYLPHRQSLSRHPRPSLLGKGSGLPSVEDCQQQRPATGTDRGHPPGVHDQLESVFRIRWTERSQSTGTGVHHPLEHAAISS